MSEQKRIAIIGAGESGVGAALLGRKLGYEVFVSEKSSIAEEYEQELSNAEIDFEEGKHSEALILNAQEIIKSPGIPKEAAIIQKAIQQGIPIISEIEFAARHCEGRIIAITGSNGKTTTTLLAYHLLKEAGFDVGLAGNVGNSFARQIAEKQHAFWVLEVSSFQLDNCYHFKPEVAVLLNITPDHLDRYQNEFQQYVDAKFRITQNLSDKESFIYFGDSEVIPQEISKRQISTYFLPISIEKPLQNGAYLKDDELHFNILRNKQSFSLKQAEINLKGKHNMINVMAAMMACLQVGIDQTALTTYFRTFEGVEHRLEEVAVIRDVTFINDSKATNVDSVYYALDSFDNRIIWIAGGVDKGNDYSKIKELVKEKVNYLICLGRDNEKLTETFRNDMKIIFQTTQIRDAVEQAYELARPGDIVLLSPACASFDLFKNYEDRGDQFKKVVYKMHKLQKLKRG